MGAQQVENSLHGPQLTASFYRVAVSVITGIWSEETATELPEVAAVCYFEQLYSEAQLPYL